MLLQGATTRREGPVPWSPPTPGATSGQAALPDCEQPERESGRKGVGAAEKGASWLGLEPVPEEGGRDGQLDGLGTAQAYLYLGTTSRGSVSQSVPWLASRRKPALGPLDAQVRMQPPKATRCTPSGLLVLAALLVLLPAPGLAAQRSRLVWAGDSPLSRRQSLDASSLPVRRAAQTAVNFYNYQQGSPNALLAPGQVKKATLKVRGDEL